MKEDCLQWKKLRRQYNLSNDKSGNSFAGFFFGGRWVFGINIEAKQSKTVLGGDVKYKIIVDTTKKLNCNQRPPIF